MLNNTKSTQREFNPSLHVSREGLRFVAGKWPLAVGVVVR